MTAPASAQSPAQAARLIHASLCLGVLLFAGVTQFVTRPSMADHAALSPTAVRALLATALGACVVALLLRRRVPSRPRDVSADQYWTTAASPALVAWAPLEAASIGAVYLYGRTGSGLALAVAGVAWLLLVALNPWSLDRRASP
jgi:hypothetical protein